MSKKENQLPPADFATLVVSLGTSVQLNLGLIGGDEETKDFPVNLQQAHYSIDLLAMLQEKTKGNLTQEEQDLLQSMLTELRMAYVEKCQHPADVGNEKIS